MITLIDGEIISKVWILGAMRGQVDNISKKLL